MKKPLLVLPLVLLAAALSLAACGGGGGGSSDEGSIEKAIETAALSNEPSKCTEVQTQKLNETESEKSGKAATKACEEEAESDETLPESVEVSNVNVNGEAATAVVAIEGGNANGQSLEVGLVKEGGDWKLNEFIKFAKYDAGALATAFEESLEAEEGVTPKLARCLTEGFKEMSQQEAESIMIEKSSKAVEKLVEACQ